MSITLSPLALAGPADDVRVNPGGEASSCRLKPQCVAVGTGDARGTVAVSTSGRAEGDLLAVSGTREARAANAVSVLGRADSVPCGKGCAYPAILAVGGKGAGGDGYAAVALLGHSDAYLLAVSGQGDAASANGAVSAVGDARGPVALSVLGTARGREACEGTCTSPLVSGSVLGDADGGILSLSLLGTARCRGTIGACASFSTVGGPQIVLP